MEFSSAATSKVCCIHAARQRVFSHMILNSPVLPASFVGPQTFIVLSLYPYKCGLVLPLSVELTFMKGDSFGQALESFL